MKYKNTSTCLLLSAVLVMSGLIYADTNTCTYKTYKWNVKLKQSVKHKTIQHSYSLLNSNEIDSITGCTVCEEDQVKITLPNIQTFAVCKLIADEVQHTLVNLIKQGETITEVTGYRVGMTRGKTDKYHNRTQFSNHSFGIALDINAQQNGLYDQCMYFSNNCRLIRGGPWRPGHKGSMTNEGSIVRQMKRLGFLWGGEIAGRQKDFMHFSPSGY